VVLLGVRWRPALVFGLGLALSSTAIGLQMLADARNCRPATASWDSRSCCSRTWRRSRCWR
jgi:hypothetical protein